MIKEWIQEYNPQNEADILNSMREIMQEIALAALSRTDFFDRAAFYGDTALRIFHGLDRFSEDLDFSLLESDPEFKLEPYFEAIILEFEGLGMKVSLREKSKRHTTPIESAFLKGETLWKELVLEDIVKQTGVKSNRSVKIKIEVDRIPPQNFEVEELLLTRPFSFYVKCFSLPSLFARKMHALLFRKWQNRVKGRDWYDFEWYVRKRVPLDLQHFLQRAKDTGDWMEKSISEEEFMQLLRNKIQNVSFDAIREDVIRFIPDPKVLDIWGERYFLDLAKQLKFETP